MCVIIFKIAFGVRVLNILEDHVANHSDKPFFIYLPFQDVHGPLQVPKQYEEMYPEIKDDDRRVFSGINFQSISNYEQNYKRKIWR